FGQHRKQAAGQRRGVLAQVEVRHQHRELVAADASGDIAFAQLLLDALADQLQQAVADRMAVAVVDELEGIEVDEQYGHGAAVTRRALDGQFAVSLELRAVDHAGQHVVRGKMLEAIAIRLGGGDVTEDRDVVLHAVVRITDGADVELLGVHAAVVAAALHFARPVVRGDHFVPGRRRQRATVGKRARGVQAHPREAFRRETGELRGRRVHREYLAFGIRDDHAFRDAGQRLRSHPPHPVAFDAFGNVADDRLAHDLLAPYRHAGLRLDRPGAAAGAAQFAARPGSAAHGILLEQVEIAVAGQFLRIAPRP